MYGKRQKKAGGMVHAASKMVGKVISSPLASKMGGEGDTPFPLSSIPTGRASAPPCRVENGEEGSTLPVSCLTWGQRSPPSPLDSKTHMEGMNPSALPSKPTGRVSPPRNRCRRDSALPLSHRIEVGRVEPSPHPCHIASDT